MGVIQEAPDWLGKDGKAKWSETVEKIGDVPPDLIEPLTFYCEAYDDFRTALAEIKDKGCTCFSEKGGAYLHPAVGRKNKAIARMKQLGAVLGWAKIETAKRKKGVASRERK